MVICQGGGTKVDYVSKLCTNIELNHLLEEPILNQMGFYKSFICVYCGIKTTDKEHLEHIVPESLGSKDTLYQGAVCTKCNNSLGSSVDNKVFEEGMFAIGQVSSGAPGKKGSRKHIHSGKGTIKKADDGGVTITNTCSGKRNEYVASRFLAKIAVNVLIDMYNSEYVRSNFQDLIRFVRRPKNKKEIWPYIATFTPLNHISEYGINIENLPYTMIFNKINFVWVINASGFFAIPVDCKSEELLKKSREYIDKTIEDAKKRGVNFGMMANYTAENKE